MNTNQVNRIVAALERLKTASSVSIIYSFGTPIQYFDGTISGNTLLDKSINGYDIDIINNDIVVGTVGIPYKSSALLAQKASNFGKVPDVNNFWFTSGGVPNQIPVVSFFQNIEYSNQIFTRHRDQLVNSSGVETVEPLIIDIVTYSTALTGSSLVSANAYFGVPTEDLTAKWVDGVNGVDAAAGTKAAPYKTCQRVITVGATKAYIKSGNTLETTNLNLSAAVQFIGTGYWLLDGNDASYTIYKASTAVCSISGAITVGSFSSLYLDNNATNLTLNRCKFTSSTNREIWGGTGISYTLNYCITTTRSIQAIGGATINGCLLTQNLSENNANTGNVVIKNNKFTSTGVNTTNVGSATVSVFGNTSSTVKFTIVNGSTLTFYSNTLYKGGRILDSRIASVIHSNKFTNNTPATNEDTIKVVDKNADIYNNLFDGTGDNSYADIYIDPSISVASVANIYNNTIKHKGINGYCIRVGDEGTTPILNLCTANIYNNICFGAWVYSQVNPIASIATHMIFVGHNNLYDVNHNYLLGGGIGIVLKGSTNDYSAGKCYSNLLQDNYIQLMAKGVSGAKFYNNTMVESLGTVILRHIAFIDNAITDGSPNGDVKNNIVNGLSASALSITVSDLSKTGFACNYNNFYTPNRAIFWDYSTITTLAGWNGAGFDNNSFYTNPLLTNMIPSLSSPIQGSGINLGATYQLGLGVTTQWPSSSSNSLPVIVIQNQSGAWDMGGYVQ